MDEMASGSEMEAVEYNSDAKTVSIQFDQEKTSPSMAVIAALAETIGADPVDLGQLHSTIETDALDALVHVRSGTTGDIHVSFTHEDHAITVSSYGVITITPVHEPTVETLEKDTAR